MPNFARRLVLAPAVLLSAAMLLGGLTAAAPASAARHRASHVRHAERRSGTHRVALRAEPVSTSLAGDPTETAPPSAPPAGSSEGTGTTTPPAAPTPPAEHEALAHPGRCQVEMQPSATVVSVGGTVTLSGTLTCPPATSTAGQTLGVFSRPRGHGEAFAEVGTVTTEADGSYHFTTAAIEAPTIFSVRLERRKSRPATVKVAPRLTLAAQPAGLQALTRGRGARNAMTLSGTVTPAVGGERVILQREYAASGEAWHTIAFGQVDDEGHYSLSHGFRIPGPVSLRIVVHAHGSSAVAISETVNVVIGQAQNAQLSISSSADPSVSGQSLSITGVAAGRAGQTVTLFARTPGHAVAAIDKLTTAADGSYAFTVAPVANTYYRTRTASARSAQLFEGVRLPLVSAAAPATAHVGEALAFTGTLLGAGEGQPVYLEAEYPSGVAFHVLAAGTVDGLGAFSIAHSFSVAGSPNRARARWPGRGCAAPASPQFTIAVS